MVNELSTIKYLKRKTKYNKIEANEYQKNIYLHLDGFGSYHIFLMQS